MSKEYLCQGQACQKISAQTNTKVGWFDLCTKNFLKDPSAFSTEAKFDQSYLTKYNDNDFVVDDDIQKLNSTPEPPASQKVLCTLKFIDGRTGYIANSTIISAFYLQVGLIKEGSFESVSTGDIFPCNNQHTFNVMQGTKFQFSLGSNTANQPPSVLQTLVNSNKMENTYEIVIPYENSVTIEVELDLT